MGRREIAIGKAAGGCGVTGEWAGRGGDLREDREGEAELQAHRRHGADENWTDARDRCGGRRGGLLQRQSDLIIASPTLEELGLHGKCREIRERWERAVKSAEDMRATNIAQRVKSTATKEKLIEASDNALKKATDEVTKNIRTYVVVDVSGSMQNAIESAKGHIARFLQGFRPSACIGLAWSSPRRAARSRSPIRPRRGCENAFRGIVAGGGTLITAPVFAPALAHLQARGGRGRAVPLHRRRAAGMERSMLHSQAAGIRPMAFGFVLRAAGIRSSGPRRCQDTAAVLGIPCFMVDERTFADPYAIPRTIRALVAATPVGTTRTTTSRVSPAETILKTDLLHKPAWA